MEGQGGKYGRELMRAEVQDRSWERACASGMKERNIRCARDSRRRHRREVQKYITMYQESKGARIGRKRKKGNDDLMHSPANGLTGNVGSRMSGVSEERMSVRRPGSSEARN
jgi:hypothetical protein